MKIEGHGSTLREALDDLSCRVADAREYRAEPTDVLTGLCVGSSSTWVDGAMVVTAHVTLTRSIER